MKNNNATYQRKDIVIRRLANGVEVVPECRPGEYIEINNCYVFTNRKEFVAHVLKVLDFEAPPRQAARDKKVAQEMNEAESCVVHCNPCKECGSDRGRPRLVCLGIMSWVVRCLACDRETRENYSTPKEAVFAWNKEANP